MKFSRERLTAQGVEVGSQSIYLTGFSYATLLSAAEMVKDRFRWSEMTDNEWDAVEASIAQMMRELFQNIMIGTVVSYMGDIIPDYLLLCDGGSYAREDYPVLYSVLPTAYITDAETFTVPDMAGLLVIGTSIAYPHTSQGGETEHTLTEAEMPSHSHIYTPPVLNVDLEDVGVPDPVAAGIGFPTYTDPTGGDQAHNNMQPYIAFYYCVVAR